LIGGDIHEGATINVDEQAGELVVTPQNPEA
jgi:ATP-dependent Clp protease ATP-binding subunit ClpB